MLCALTFHTAAFAATQFQSLGNREVLCAEVTTTRTNWARARFNPLETGKCSAPLTGAVLVVMAVVFQSLGNREVLCAETLKK